MTWGSNHKGLSRHMISDILHVWDLFGSLFRFPGWLGFQHSKALLLVPVIIETRLPVITDGNEL